MQARRDLLGEDASDDAARVLEGPIVRRLLDGQQPDGGFGVNVYNKWHGGHWRLVSLGRARGGARRSPGHSRPSNPFFAGSPARAIARRS